MVSGIEKSMAKLHAITCRPTRQGCLNTGGWERQAHPAGPEDRLVKLFEHLEAAERLSESGGKRYKADTKRVQSGCKEKEKAIPPGQPCSPSARTAQCTSPLRDGCSSAPISGTQHRSSHPLPYPSTLDNHLQRCASRPDLVGADAEVPVEDLGIDARLSAVRIAGIVRGLRARTSDSNHHRCQLCISRRSIHRGGYP